MTSKLDEPDPERVRRAIRDRGEEIKRRELRRAFARLDAHGDLTAAQRDAVERMATAIVDGVLAAPEAMLQRTADHDRETVRTAVELFDPGE